MLLCAPEFEPEVRLCDYGAGILDTLDGSHGFCFTYLPIVFQDDCQVVSYEGQFRISANIGYIVNVKFLEAINH